MQLCRMVAGVALAATVLFAQSTKSAKRKRAAPARTAITNRVEKTDPYGWVYLNLPGGGQFANGCAGISIQPIKQKEQTNPPENKYESGVCIIHLAEGLYFITIERRGYWRYTTAPFSISPGQIITHQPNLSEDTLWDRFADHLKYLTIIAAIVAIIGLFREQLIRALIHYPDLVVIASKDKPHCHMAPMSWAQMAAERRVPEAVSQAGAVPATSPDPKSGTAPADTFNVFFARLFIENQGTGEVDDVEVFVSAIWDLTKDEKITQFLPLNLRWANSWPFYRPQPKLENDEPVRKARISAGIGRFCDLGFIVDPSNATRYYHESGITAAPEIFGTAPRFQFAFESLNTAYGRLVNPHLLLELAIDGANMETEFFYVELDAAGAWHNTEGTEKFELKPATRDQVRRAAKDESDPKQLKKTRCEHLYSARKRGFRLGYFVLKALRPMWRAVFSSR